MAVSKWKSRKSAATFPVDGRVGVAGEGRTKRIRVSAGGFLSNDARIRGLVAQREETKTRLRLLRWAALRKTRGRGVTRTSQSAFGGRPIKSSEYRAMVSIRLP